MSMNVDTNEDVFNTVFTVPASVESIQGNEFLMNQTAMNDSLDFGAVTPQNTNSHCNI
jgi:hypothetical protein